MYIHISADPGLCLGQGGAWDHRRCGPLAVVLPAFETAICCTGLGDCGLTGFKPRPGKSQQRFHQPLGRQVVQSSILPVFKTAVW